MKNEREIYCEKRMHTKEIHAGNIILEILMLIITALVGYPLFVMVMCVFKTPLQMADWVTLPSQFYTNNIVKVFMESGFIISLLNSLFVTGISIVLLIVFGCMAAYPLGRRTERMFDYLFIYTLIGIMLPLQFSILPIFQLVKNLGLMDTRIALILVETAFNLPFTCFIYKNFIKSVPVTLEEAAEIDGASYFVTFWKIIFPLLKPATATVIIVNLIGVWNDFLSPLILISDPTKQTIPLMIQGFKGAHSSDIGAIFTTLTFASIPLVVLYLSLQKEFYKGMTTGAVKA